MIGGGHFPSPESAKQKGPSCSFSKNFFLEHFNYSAQKVTLSIAGLPDAATSKALLRELQGFRQVLDAQPVGDTGTYQLQLADGNASDLINDAVLKPLNTKLGQNCFPQAVPMRRFAPGSTLCHQPVCKMPPVHAASCCRGNRSNRAA